MSNSIIAILLGIIGTMLYHISKGMQRQGIEIIDRFRDKITGKTIPGTSYSEKNRRNNIIYITGVIMNNSLTVFIILANRYAPTSYFTSMFGIGLVALMFYSARILHEPIKGIEYFGSAVLITGTVVLGIEGIGRPCLDVSMINIKAVWVIVGIFLPSIIVCMYFAYRSGRPYVIGIVFGLFTGGVASLDPIFKGIGQNLGSAGFFPSSGMGWLIFSISFIFATAAFTVAQWGFYKKAQTSVLIPSFNSMYVTMPIIIQGFALPDFKITYITGAGLILVVTGIFLMQVFKEEVNIKE